MQHALATLAPEADEAERAILAALADGAPGRARGLAETGALAVYREIVEVLSGLPRLNGAKLFALAEKIARGEGGVARFVALVSQLEERLLRGAFAALPTVPGEEPLLRHLRATVPLDRWSGLWEGLRLAAADADELNLDKKQFVLNTFFAIEAAAQP
jgi:DNA polymerase-3 subunit delta'